MPIRHVVSVTSRLSRLSDSGESDIQSTEMYVFLSVSPESATQGTKTYVWMSDSPESDIRDIKTLICLSDSAESDNLALEEGHGPWPLTHYERNVNKR